MFPMICKQRYLVSVSSKFFNIIISIIIRVITEFFFPGGGLLIYVFGALLTGARIAKAAGPSDCWTGHPDEKLLRKNEKKLTSSPFKERLFLLREQLSQ